jgi:phosphoserine phosphatase
VLRSLKDQSLAELQTSAKIYVQGDLSAQKIDLVHERLEQMKSQGWTPILVSNALYPVIAEIGHTLDLPYVSSTLDDVSGVLTGRLCKDLTGQKRKALEAFLGRSLSTVKFAVLTDNKSDRDLVAAAQSAVLISAGTPRKWMREWNVEILCH